MLLLLPGYRGAVTSSSSGISNWSPDKQFQCQCQCPKQLSHVYLASNNVQQQNSVCLRHTVRLVLQLPGVAAVWRVSPLVTVEGSPPPEQPRLSSRSGSPPQATTTIPVFRTCRVHNQNQLVVISQGAHTAGRARRRTPPPPWARSWSQRPRRCSRAPPCRKP